MIKKFSTNPIIEILEKNRNHSGKNMKDYYGENFNPENSQKISELKNYTDKVKEFKQSKKNPKYLIKLEEENDSGKIFIIADEEEAKELNNKGIILMEENIEFCDVCECNPCDCGWGS